MPKWQVFDIVGPIMVGPSSSHTSGAVRLGLVARQLLGDQPDKAIIGLHGSYAEVYQGHGTDLALVAGLLGFEPDDEKVVVAFDEAKKAGLEYRFEKINLGSDCHPNAARFVLQKGKYQLEIVGISIGAGRIEITEIDGIPTSSIDGLLDTLIVSHSDQPGLLAGITSVIASANINIAKMAVSRSKKGERALTVANLDQELSQANLTEISQVKGVSWVKQLARIV